MLVIAYTLLYFSIGVGFTTLWQVTVADLRNQDEVAIVAAVFMWPPVFIGVGTYHAVKYLTRYFRDKYRNPDSGER